MVRKLNLKISVNKTTGQLCTTLPKKKISKKLLKEIMGTKKIKVEVQ